MTKLYEAPNLHLFGDPMVPTGVSDDQGSRTEFMDGSALVFLKNRVRWTMCLTFSNVSELLQRVETADALIVRNRTRVTSDLLAAAGHLKAIGRLGVGLDNIDQQAAAIANIQVLPATGANASQSEYVMSAMLICGVR